MREFPVKFLKNTAKRGTVVFGNNITVRRYLNMFENLVEILKANPRKIVYTEGSDSRILESAARLKKDGFLTPVLVGNVEEVKAAKPPRRWAIL